MLGVGVNSVVLQALDGMQTELQLEAAENLDPVLLNSTFCSNVVLKVREAGSELRGFSFCGGRSVEFQAC